MTLIKIKGHEFSAKSIKDSYNRRSQKFKNNIIISLKYFGLTEDDVELDLEPVAIKNILASVTWYMEGSRLHYSYNRCNKYAENLYVVSKLIELEIKAIIDGNKTVEEFIKDFEEEDDDEEERKKARELLGLEQDIIDLKIINKKYKDLSKNCHPDTENGDVEKFKELNKAHKVLKRELE